MKPGQIVLYSLPPEEGGTDIEAQVVEVSSTGSAMIRFEIVKRVAVFRWVGASALRHVPPPPLTAAHQEFA
jgi:hypothetical protein